MSLTTISGEIQAQPLNDNFSYLNTRKDDLGINVKDYGAIGDGTTDDTAAIQAAITAATGYKLKFPSGIYIVTGLTGVNNILIEGVGRDIVTLKRKTNSTGSLSIIEFSGKSNFTIKGITFDGNKTNQSVSGSSNLSIVSCGNWIIEDCKFINAKSLGGYGNGLTVSEGTNDTESTTSRVKNNLFESNDADGFFLNKEWNIEIKNNFFYLNGGSGLDVLNYVFPPVPDVSNNLTIVNNFALSNSGSGIVVSGFITGGTPSKPTSGVSIPQSRLVVVEGNICNENGQYGLVFQGTNGVVNGNICEHNSRNVNYGAGILFNADSSICSNNCTRDNKAYGIDAGGVSNSIISNNQSVYEGMSDNTSAIHINVGASTYCIVEGNLVRMSSTLAKTGIYYSGIDGGDPIIVFPIIGTGSSIIGNQIMCNSNSGSIGIFAGRRCLNAVIRENTIFVNTANQAILTEVSNAVCEKNDIFAIEFSGSRIASIPAASTTIIPDGMENFYFTTGSGTIDYIKTYSQNFYNEKVVDVAITNQGSGYDASSLPTISFSGGGGVSAAATPQISNEGYFIGVKMTNYGSGYTSTPTVTISGGAGISAAGTALVGVNNHEGKEISIMFQGNITVVNGGNLALNGDFNAINGSILKLRGAFGNWYEISRRT